MEDTDGMRENVVVRRSSEIEEESLQATLQKRTPKNKYSSAYLAMDSLYESRTPQNLCCSRKFHIVVPTWVQTGAGQSMVISENGNLNLTINSGYYRIKTLVPTEVFWLHSGNVDHMLKFSLASRPQNIGSHANLSVSYKIDNPVLCLKEGSLEQPYLRPVMFRSAHESVNDWQNKSGGKPLVEFNESDYQEIGKILRDKMGPVLSTAGLRLNEVFLAIDVPYEEIERQQAKKRLSIFSELLELRGAIEMRSLELEAKKREFESTALRKNKIAGMLESSEAAIKVREMIREDLKYLEDKTLQGDSDMLSRVLAYERLKLLSSLLPDSNEGTREQSQDPLVNKILEAELSKITDPTDLKMARVLGESLSRANIDLRLGKNGIEEVLKDGADIVSNLYRQLKLPGRKE